VIADKPILKIFDLYPFPYSAQYVIREHHICRGFCLFLKRRLIFSNRYRIVKLSETFSRKDHSVISLFLYVIHARRLCSSFTSYIL